MKPFVDPRDWRLVHGIAVLLVLAFLLVDLRAILSPLILFAALTALMVPYAGSQFHRLLVITTGLLVALWVLKELGTLVAPFILAFVLAYVFDPVVDRLVAWRVPRSLGVALLGLPLLGGLAALIFLGIPALAQQVETLIERAPQAIAKVADWLQSLQAGLLRVDIPLLDEAAVSQALRDVSPAAVTEFLEERQQAIAQRAWGAVLGLGRGVGTVFTILGYLVLTPVLTFYLLRDYDRIIARLGTYVPRARVRSFGSFAREYDHSLARFLRGQLIVALIVGVLTWIGLLIARFPNPGLVGLVAGVFNIVPYLGLIVSLVPATIIALVSGAFLASMLKVAIVFGIVQFLDGNIIGPRIVGESVGLHPVWVILAIAVGGFSFGFVGLLLGIPTALLLKLLLRAGLARYRESRIYQGADTTV